MPDREKPAAVGRRWIERLPGLVLLAAGVVMCVGVWRLTQMNYANRPQMTVVQQVLMLAVMLPFTSIPIAFVLLGLRGILGERPWIEQPLRRTKWALVAWIAVVGGGLLILLTVQAVRYWMRT